MTDSLLFSRALGLSDPWYVESVDFDAKKRELNLELDFVRGSKFACPICAKPRPVHDTVDRTWRHLNFFEHKTYLHASVPRTDCPECGVKMIDVTWAELGSGFTLLFQAFVMTLARHMPVRAISALVGEHDTRLWRMIQRIVEAARKEEDHSGVRRIGIDETACKRGREFVTVFADMDERRVLFVADGKDAATVGKFAQDIKEHGGDPQNVSAASMDMSMAFQAGVTEAFPAAEIVFDRFHVMKLVNSALDEIRRCEVRENAVLKQTRYAWLKNPENLTESQKQIVESLEHTNLATVDAYQMKLNLQELWEQPSKRYAERFLEGWYQWVMGSQIGNVMKQAAKSIKGRATGILNYYDTGLTNGLMEGINSLIQAARTKARGYRNTAYFKTMIYLIAGDLDLRLPI